MTSDYNEGYSSIQPGNIPIPLGLPIVYFHGNESKRESNLKFVETVDVHHENRFRKRKRGFLAKAGLKRGKIYDIPKQGDVASLTQQMVLKDLQNRRRLSWREEEPQVLNNPVGVGYLLQTMRDKPLTSADLTEHSNQCEEQLGDGWTTSVIEDQTVKQDIDLHGESDHDNQRLAPAPYSTTPGPSIPPETSSTPKQIHAHSCLTYPPVLPMTELLSATQVTGVSASQGPILSPDTAHPQLYHSPSRSSSKRITPENKEIYGSSDVISNLNADKSMDHIIKRTFVTAGSLRRRMETKTDEAELKTIKLIATARLTIEERTREERARGLTADQRFELLQRLFLIIQMGSVAEMQSFLAFHCNPVEIVPKFGCKRRYYDPEMNLVNARDHFGNCPLLLSCKMGSSRNKMTKLLLKYGANPNQTDEFKECPLVYVAQSVSLEPNSENIEILRDLLHHGAEITQVVETLCDTLETPNKESCTAMMSLTALIQPEYLVLTKDPIKTAHLVNSMLIKASVVKEEYISDCKILAKSARDFTYDYLDRCRTLWEARRLLCGSSYIENALETKEKRFLSHPFCQEIILEDFYGDKDFKGFKRKVLFSLKSFTAFFIGPLYFLLVIQNSLIAGRWRYRYSRLDFLARSMLTPFYSFLSDLLNYAILLGLLFYVAITVPTTLNLSDEIDVSANRSEYEILRSNSSISLSEITLWLCILSRVQLEVYQLCIKGPKKYFFNFWNHVDVLICVLSIVASAIRFWNSTVAVEISRTEEVIETWVEDFKTSTLTSIYIYCE